MNELAKSQGEEAEYEVIVSEKDREPLEVV
jgi:hypothetical protein